MSKFFCETQDAATYLVYQIQNSDELDLMSLGMMTNNAIPGIAAASFVQMETTKHIKYDISAKVSVDKLFDGAVTKKQLMGVFTGIVNAMLAAEEYMIDPTSLLLDLKYIFTDPDTCETVMVCLPVMNTEDGSCDVRMFFKNIIFNVHLDENESHDCVIKILNYIMSAPVFFLADFKELLSQLPANEETMKDEQINSGEFGDADDTWDGSLDSPWKDKLPLHNTRQFVGNEFNPGKWLSDEEEKPMSLFCLLNHYNRENYARYKAQKRAMKKGSSSQKENPKEKLRKDTAKCRFCGKKLSTADDICRECREAVRNHKPQVELSKVQFSAISPESFPKGEYCMVDIFMYEESCREVLNKLISEAKYPVQERNSGMYDVEKNARIRIVLTSPDIEISDNEDDAVWVGGYLQFSYPVCVPKGYRNGQVRFCAAVYINEIIASRIRFVAKCTAKQKQRPKIEREDIMSAFVSYASKDRSRVAMVIQGIKKARPDLDIFLDVDSLRSGENWEEAIEKEIVSRDIFYLCWSQAACQSKWVEKEWRYALRQKGLDFIDPIAIEPPATCPPPEELRKKHFSDRMLCYID